jgi:hypothetical protein
MALIGGSSDIEEALAAVQAFGAGPALTARISDLEMRLHGKTRDKAATLLAADHINETALSGALTIKQLSAQIDVVIHALGILTSLPYVLKRGEVIQSLSLGAGNTSRHHDLETDRQIAEFKFIQWRGGSEAIRQNNVFIDVFNLARESTTKRRVLYLLDKRHALRLLRNRRAIGSVLSKNASVHARFRAAHHDQFATVREYWATIEHRVEIVDLRGLVPAFKGAVSDHETSAVPKDPLK